MKPGGKEGGMVLFVCGALLLGLGLYLLLHSVHVVQHGAGAISRGLGGGRRGGGMGETTSMGIIFVPFLIGVGVLFYDATKKWAWWICGIGFAILLIEIFSRIGFRMDIKVAHLLGMLLMIAAGTGMVIRAYLIDKNTDQQTINSTKQSGQD